MTDELERRLSDAAETGPTIDLQLLRATLARRAADDGLLDVGYGTYESPLGTLTVILNRFFQNSIAVF